MRYLQETNPGVNKSNKENGRKRQRTQMLLEWSGLYGKHPRSLKNIKEISYFCDNPDEKRFAQQNNNLIDVNDDPQVKRTWHVRPSS